ncbi:B3 domain-containing protein REM5-like [Hibiscus syriacus]|uniref:B3 domain-containing protein REM5-like n=1 Tax=Hibiscus syriacus TaxID=106335 RepID=UPI001924C35F|nr:B3 domain-containing protein REM5-like [Hibiscus syriacus]
MSNAKFTPKIPHFFQPLLPGFHNHLSIPLAFFKHYLKTQTNGPRAVLRSHGRTWPVKIRDRRFEDGWGDFARDHDLHVGDFLLFGYGGDMVFDVVVFDTSACQREYPVFAKDHHQTRSPTASSGHGSPHFVATLSHYCMKRFRLVSINNIPRKFARFNGLMGRSCEIVVVDEQRRSWMASLGHKESDGQVYIGCGWRNICIGNNLKAMDCVVIELIGNGTMPVFKLHKVEDDEDDKGMANYPASNAGCSGRTIYF